MHEGSLHQNNTGELLYFKLYTVINRDQSKSIGISNCTFMLKGVRLLTLCKSFDS